MTAKLTADQKALAQAKRRIEHLEKIAGERSTTGAHIENVSITNTSAANEFTRDAVVALANAVKANAEALSAAANALKGSPATMNHGIHLSDIGK